MADLNLLLCSLEAYGPVKEQRAKNGWRSYKCCCPAHSDTHPSMVVTEIEQGKILVKCWAGCSTREILFALNLRWNVLMPDLNGYRIEPKLKSTGATYEQWLVAICDANKHKFFTRQDKENELAARKRLMNK